MTTTIATLAEFAYAIRKTEAQAARHQLLLELAEGLVIENLGVLDTYPVSAKAVALEAAARAYFALRAAEQEGVPADRQSMARFVYLDDEQIGRLAGPIARGPQFSFPGTWPYPDPVERAADPISWP
jgi:malonyl CoA-acyl carrier protein transacylase